MGGEKGMTQNLHMSGIIMYAGLTARMVVPELCGMIPVLWQSPFHFTDEIWLWWYGVGVILTLTKRGLSQPPEAFGEEGVCNCREGYVSKWEGLSVGRFEWMHQLLLEEMLRERKWCREGEHACLHKLCLACWSAVMLPVSTAHTVTGTVELPSGSWWNSVGLCSSQV